MSKVNWSAFLGFSQRLTQPQCWPSHMFYRTPLRSSSCSVIYGLLCHSAKSQLWNWVMAHWKGRPWSLSTSFFPPLTLSVHFHLSFCRLFFPCSFSDATIDLLSSGPADLADSPVRKWIFQPTLDWLHLWLRTPSGHGTLLPAHCSEKGNRARDEEENEDRNDFYCGSTWLLLLWQVWIVLPLERRVNTVLPLINI